jgi:NADH:ubiquinone oxidoreductase subunit 2 (subunit N)
MLAQLAGLIPVLPLLASGWIALGYVIGKNRGERGERHTARVILGAAALSLVLVLALDILALLRQVPGQVQLGLWLSSGPYQVRISFTLDWLGLAMTTLVATLSLLTLRFSVHYMHREAGFQRFFMTLSLFMAGNAVLTFVGWELAGVSSYLLIAYAFDRPTATGNAERAFITNRIGDAGFVMGIFLAFFWLGDIEWPAILEGRSDLDSLNIGLIAAAFLLAALVKSAQVPFAPWIARALEGPTPSSAIFYGSLMVHAGVYLVIRLQPLLEQAPALMLLLVVLGLLTALYGFLGGLVQTDVKSALIFSTTAQVGLMFLACGLGGFTLAAWYLAAHALWRAYQFLSAPALMHLASRPARPVPAWLQRQRWLYTASLQRFWLDPLANALLVRPTQSLARDVHTFDEQVVTPLIGLPEQTRAISSLAQWEAQRQGYFTAEGNIARGQGLLGRLLEWIASVLHWFEEHLVLKGGGEGLLGAIQHIGRYLMRIESLLSQPRYLLLLILATFVVIL